MNSYCRVFLLLLAVALTSYTLPAQETLLSYRGVLKSGGTAYNGSAQLRFAFVASANRLVWGNSEFQDGQPLTAVSCVVSEGHFNVWLGDTNLPNMRALPASVLAEPELKLRVWADDGTNGSVLLAPDQLLSSVPRAVVAGTLAGTIESSQIVGTISGQHIAPSTITSLMLAPEAVSGTNLQNGSIATNHLDTILRRTLEDRFSDVVNVRSYGVKANGFDDWEAIQACIDAESGKRNTFYFPAGTYFISKPIKIRRENTRILGDGPDRTLFRQTGANQHGITIEPAAGNYGGSGAMWNTYLEGFCMAGPGRTNSTAAGINLAHPTLPGAYFADMLKLTRVRVGNSLASGFKYGISISNCVSVVAELCEFKYATEAVRLAKCDSAWFVECQTGYTGLNPFLAWRTDPETVCFNIFGRGLGTHILGGEHGHMYRFANISEGSIVNIYGGNYESFADAACKIWDSHVTISNPRMALATAEVPIYRLAKGAQKVVVLGGDYGGAQTIFVMEKAGELPNYIGAPVKATNSATGGGLFDLSSSSPSSLGSSPYKAITDLQESNRRLRADLESLKSQVRAISPKD